MTEKKDRISTDEEEAPSRLSPGRLLRHPIQVALTGILVVAVLALGGMVLFRPHVLSSLLWSAYREQTSGASVPGESAGSGEEDSILPMLALVQVDRPFGFLSGRSSVLLQMYVEEFPGTDLGFPRHWLWRVNVSDGRFDALNRGDLSAVVARGGEALFLEKAPIRSGMGGVQRWLPPVLLLRLIDRQGKVERIAEGDLNTRWFGFSPDEKRAFYHRRDDSGVHVKLADFESGAERTWEAKWPKSAEGAEGDPRGSEARIVAWLEDGKSLLRMVRSPVEVPVTGQRWAVSGFEVASVETGEITESVPGFNDRVWISGPEYNHAGYFTVVTRARTAPNMPWNSRVDIYGVSPLRYVASFPGDSVFWSPDGKVAEIDKPEKESQPYSGIIGIYRAGSDRVEEVKIRDMNPALYRVLPYSFSPDSKKLLAASYRSPRLAILDVASLTPVRVLEGLNALEGSWSPGGRYVALVGLRGEEERARPFILDSSNGDLRELDLPMMRPLDWLDARTVLFINRWVGQQREKSGPLQIARVDCVTGEIRIVPLE